MPDATLKQIREYFGMPVGDFSREWRELDDESKSQLKRGIGDGTFTY